MSMLVSMDDAVSRFGLTRAEIYRRVKDGVLTADKVDRRLHFQEAEVARYRAVLDRERDLLSRLLDRWLPWFGERLAAYGDPPAVVCDVDDHSVDTRVAELGDRMLQHALRSGASDLHLDPLHAGARLVCGSGSREEMARFDAVLSSRLVPWIVALTELQPIGDAGVREGLAKKEWGATACQIRVREIPTVLGPHYHLHLFVDYADTTLGAIGYTSEQSGAVLRLLTASRGLFLIADAGDPRDDRHRLLLARRLVRNGRLVVSIERRVQYQEESLIQLELKQSASELGDEEFQVVWRAALDMSPDVIVVDEVLSAPQVAALLAGAASGVVIALRMAGDRLAAAGARLTDLGADRHALTRALLGGVERVIVRRLCPECRVRNRASDDEVAALGFGTDAAVAHPAGCSRCRDGYAGRRAVYGLWRDGPELARALTAGPNERHSTASGEQDFEEAVRGAVVDGEVTAADAVALLRCSRR